jgi:hypothetical protein
VRLAGFVVVFFGLPVMCSGAQGTDSPAERLRAMRAFASGITVELFTRPVVGED